jgi:hypothetical protein
MKWLTRERPKSDRIACLWPTARCVDEARKLLCVVAADVLDAVAKTGTAPCEIRRIGLGGVRRAACIVPRWPVAGSLRERKGEALSQKGPASDAKSSSP